jgi:trk system potassium uptake protein TrkH
MHLFSILHVFGTLFLVTGISMVMPVICALIYGEGDFAALLISSVIIIVLGLPLWWFFRKHHDLSIRDGIFIAAFGWILVSALSTLPFMIYGSIPSFTDAFFEMMSGYTTSGATILTDIETVPHGLLFWRSETHLLGGMGFLTLTVIFLPHGMGDCESFGRNHLPAR